MKLPKIPIGSILGVHYNGCHDTSVAAVGPDGSTLFACSLERLSRVKGDSRPPQPLLELLPLDRFLACALPFFKNSPDITTRIKVAKFHRTLHGIPGREIPSFPESFMDVIESIPLPLEWHGHQNSHAAAAYYSSGFNQAVVLVYDGGMYQCPWFGGVYVGAGDTLVEHEMFSTLTNCSIASFYAIITSALGFRPLRHEGKIMGLAAYAAPDTECIAILNDFFVNHYEIIETAFLWFDSFSFIKSALTVRDDYILSLINSKLSSFSREVIAASLQRLLENHVLEIVEKIVNEFGNTNICLAGGLFANVKLNQYILSHPKIEKMHVFPAMGDEGTSLGAAFCSLIKKGVRPKSLTHMYLGPSFEKEEIDRFILEKGLSLQPVDDAPKRIAEMVYQGKVVGIFNGSMEFGPRALGNRSLIAKATDKSINDWLNKKLSRTEFMPFAPFANEEDADALYGNIWRRAYLCAQFMTITFIVADHLQKSCPGVVHVDGTSRPQIIHRDSSPLFHAIIEEYKAISDCECLINTSFNLHEEPIVCTPEDAWRGFLQADLDALYLDGYLITRDNIPADTVHDPIIIEDNNIACDVLDFLWRERYRLFLIERSAERIALQLAEKQQNININHEIICKQREIIYWTRRKHLPSRIKDFLTPRLGHFFNYLPRELTQPPSYTSKKPHSLPTFSIAIPSFNQGLFIQETIESLCCQNHSRLECIIQDGGSSDSTVNTLKEFDSFITYWESKKDYGQADAINCAFSHSTGEIMSWLNSDDLLLNDTLHYVGDFFAANPDVDVVYGHRVIIDEKSREIGRWVLPKHDGEVLSWADYIPQETLFWRRSIWDKVGGRLDDSFHFALDWDLILRFRDAGAKFVRLPRFLAAFRVHPEQKTMSRINQEGRIEMAALRQRCHGRPVTEEEAARHSAAYLRHHLLHHILFCFGIYI